ncbi:MAG TPA: peptidylprolyl isomerase [Pyrinomonadaceae bacterium]|nr:peptidylprolyl isomerase [Pyrinomonadaceae bacterium]
MSDYEMENRQRGIIRLGRRLPAYSFLACALILAAWGGAVGQQRRPKSPQPPKPAPAKPVPADVMLRVVRAEDERRFDNDLGVLLFDKEASVRERAALAAGRIGDERAVASLIALLQTDMEESVRARAAFALGEIESAAGAASLVEAAQKAKESAKVRARAVEALGKIAAALPKADEARAKELGEAILKTLEDERRSAKPNRDLVLLGLTAALRGRPAGAGPIVARFLNAPDARVRADAANTLARLRAKDGLAQLRALVANDPDPVVRANAARALGAAEDAGALDPLAARAVNDSDERVRVSAIRSLGALKDARGAAPLLQRAATLTPAHRAAKASAAGAHPAETNELLEIAASLGRLLANTNDERAVAWLRTLREMEPAAPEVEVAFARVAPFAYLRESPFSKLSDERARAETVRDWRRVSALSQALAEIAGIKAEAAGSGIVSLQADAQIILRSWIDAPDLHQMAAPDVLRALAAFKPQDLAQTLRKQLGARDVIVRATAAELLGEVEPDESNARLLAEALPAAARDELNDAALSILDSLAKQKSYAANEAIKTMLDSQDTLVRRRAAALLKANGAGDFSQRAAAVRTRNTDADYGRALSRLGKSVRAVVNTEKGTFTIELLPDEAALNVDNFVRLAQGSYFNNVTFHRVVPNFVVQGGDPRGDGNGGPGYQIRCEVNEVPYERGAVGMALSGKDTGGSQWFVTHSPQPHLDGGYTVFGRVTSGMDVVDRIARGDRILSVTVTEGARETTKTDKSSPGANGRKKRKGQP